MDDGTKTLKMGVLTEPPCTRNSRGKGEAEPNGGRAGKKRSVYASKEVLSLLVEQKGLQQMTSKAPQPFLNM